MGTPYTQVTNEIGNLGIYADRAQENQSILLSPKDEAWGSSSGILITTMNIS